MLDVHDEAKQVTNQEPPTSLQLAAASRRKGRGGRRSGGPRTVDGATATNGAAKPAGNARTRYAGAVPAANGNRAAPAAPVAAPLQADATRILISNLPHDVTEPQIKVRLDASKRAHHFEFWGWRLSSPPRKHRIYSPRQLEELAM